MTNKELESTIKSNETRGGLIALAAAAGMLAMISTGPAMSADGAHSAQGYLGGGIGYYRVEDDDFDIDESNESFKVYGGVEVGDYFGLQAQYIDFLEAEGSGGTYALDGFTVAATGGIPLANGSSVYAKGGILFWDADFEGSGLIPDAENDGNDPFFGLGLKLGIIPDAFNIRIEYERFAVDDTDIDLGSVNAEISF